MNNSSSNDNHFMNDEQLDELFDEEGDDIGKIFCNNDDEFCDVIDGNPEELGDDIDDYKSFDEKQEMDVSANEREESSRITSFIDHLFSVNHLTHQERIERIMMFVVIFVCSIIGVVLGITFLSLDEKVINDIIVTETENINNRINFSCRFNSQDVLVYKYSCHPKNRKDITNSSLLKEKKTNVFIDRLKHFDEDEMFNMSMDNNLVFLIEMTKNKKDTTTTYDLPLIKNISV